MDSKTYGILSAIKQTEAYINKEMKYSEDLRNHELLAWYQNHLVRLNKMLAENETTLSN